MQLVALFGLLVLLCGEVRAADAASAGPAPRAGIRVLSYNIHHGEGDDRKLDLDRIARILRQSDADFIALQEVDVKTTRTGMVDQAKALAEKLGFHYEFGKAIDFGGGEYGNVVLSRWPIVKSKTIALPNPARKEARSLVWARVEVPGVGPVVFASTHFSHDSAECRTEQAKVAATVGEGVDAALVILAGDLNAVPTDPALKPLMDGWIDSAAGAHPPIKTIPADKPKHQIDFVLARKPQAAQWNYHVKVLDEPMASDHRPVLATLIRKDK